MNPEAPVTATGPSFFDMAGILNLLTPGSAISRLETSGLCLSVYRVCTLGVKWSQPRLGALNPAVPTKNPYLIQSVRGSFEVKTHRQYD
jgi:hypothetical protein